MAIANRKRDSLAEKSFRQSLMKTPCELESERVHTQV